MALIAVALSFVGGFSSAPVQIMTLGAFAALLGIVAFILLLFGLRYDLRLAVAATLLGLLVAGSGVLLSVA